MPNNLGELSDQERAKAEEWLRERLNDGPDCSLCGGREWIICKHLVRVFAGNTKGDVLVGGASYPKIMLLCKNCGNTLLFNALFAGIIEQLDSPKNERNEPDAA